MEESLPALDCWFLTGATAVGKTEIGLVLAERLGAEIVSLDSMTIYRGMDIGTAKPSPQQQAGVPHHMIDIVDPDEEYSINCYLEAAHAKIAEIKSRGNEVLFVGGTPLYLKALLRGLNAGPPANWPLREEIEAEVAKIGNQALYQRLEQLDPIAASQIHPNDTRRLIRAVEVFRATGQPISHHQLHFEQENRAEDCRVFVLQRTREEQIDRINRRVDAMIEKGLVEEVQHLIANGKTLGRTASQAVGYREAIEHLQGSTLDTMATHIKTRTRRFAKRQGTWFRSLAECRFVEL
ncbi:MAG: tRNA (adenosine(37)-N6)-dimethylallyltransferase MiaA, partial [Planctomycetes bacterium]|nr:tRNA (adenosine(37)-N6)-dimethylallyltransferase MiaA [Planctomycetota bacterium]